MADYQACCNCNHWKLIENYEAITIDSINFLHGAKIGQYRCVQEEGIRAREIEGRKKLGKSAEEGGREEE